MWSRSRPLALLLAAATAACAGNPAPRGYLLPAPEAARAARGGWIRVETTDAVIDGELLVAGPDTLHVLTPAGVVATPVAGVQKARLWTHQGAPVGTVAGVGLLTTLSHGAVLLLTAPMWAFTWIFGRDAETKATRIDYPRRPLDEMRPFARFPQGETPGVDLGALPGSRRRNRKGPPVRRRPLGFRSDGCG